VDKSPKGNLICRLLLVPLSGTIFDLGLLSKMAVSLADERSFWTPLAWLLLSEDVSLSEEGASGCGEPPWLFLSRFFWLTPA
jgi:hypothetical protein